jgi:hypothetical protein
MVARKRNPLFCGLLAIPLLPLGLLSVLVQDLLAVVEKFGLHLAWEDKIVVLEHYHEGRVLVELLLESFPQAAFQTALYVLGSSRATRFYIDEHIFVQSIVLSLLSLSMQYCCMVWKAVYEGMAMGRVFLDRLGSAGQTTVAELKLGTIRTSSHRLSSKEGCDCRSENPDGRIPMIQT